MEAQGQKASSITLILGPPWELVHTYIPLPCLGTHLIQPRKRWDCRSNKCRRDAVTLLSSSP